MVILDIFFEHGDLPQGPYRDGLTESRRLGGSVGFNRAIQSGGGEGFESGDFGHFFCVKKLVFQYMGCELEEF